MGIAKASSLVEHSGQCLRNFSFRNSGRETNKVSKVEEMYVIKIVGMMKMKWDKLP